MKKRTIYAVFIILISLNFSCNKMTGNSLNMNHSTKIKQAKPTSSSTTFLNKITNCLYYGTIYGTLSWKGLTTFLQPTNGTLSMNYMKFCVPTNELSCDVMCPTFISENCFPTYNESHPIKNSITVLPSYRTALNEYVPEWTNNEKYRVESQGDKATIFSIKKANNWINFVDFCPSTVTIPKHNNKTLIVSGIKGPYCTLSFASFDQTGNPNFKTNTNLMLPCNHLIYLRPYLDSSTDSNLTTVWYVYPDIHATAILVYSLTDTFSLWDYTFQELGTLDIYTGVFTRYRR